MSRVIMTLAACVMLLPAAVMARSDDEALAWLERIAKATQELDYSGVFTYQSGSSIETSRITRMVSDGGAHERLEVLDGSPREVIRRDGEVWCVFPEQKMVIRDRSLSLQQRAFPARLPAVSYGGLAAYYDIQKGGTGRVAGHNAQMIQLDPRDELRYSHLLWAEEDSGLLLKARTVDDEGRLIEQFSFSDVQIGGDIDAGGLEPRYRKDDDWHVVSAYGNEVDADESGWIVSEPLPGYELKSVLLRPLGRNQRDVLHMVFSDGLASISVFIEPVSDEVADEGLGPVASGAINVYRRNANGHLLTALGEVPLEALRRLGEAMEPVEQ